MFTGIISGCGKITEVIKTNRGKSLVVETTSVFAKGIELGESIACNGVCLTVEKMPRRGSLVFFISPETLNKTCFGKAQPGDLLNLERALRLQDRLSGHIVQGHVDGTAEITKITETGKCYEIRLKIPQKLRRYCIEKGSIAIDGISLTINKIVGSEISLMIIPHTWKHTSLAQKRLGQCVNLEVDLLAKIVEKLLQK